MTIKRKLEICVDSGIDEPYAMFFTGLERHFVTIARTVKSPFSVDQSGIEGRRTLGLSVCIERVDGLMTPVIDHNGSEIDIVIGCRRSVNHERAKDTFPERVTDDYGFIKILVRPILECRLLSPLTCIFDNCKVTKMRWLRELPKICKFHKHLVHCPLPELANRIFVELARRRSSNSRLLDPVV